MSAWRKITGKARQPRRKKRPLFTCGSCGKGFSSPLGHTCSGGGDLTRRRAKAQRAGQAAAARQESAEKRAKARGGTRAKVAAARRQEREKAAARIAGARKREREKAAAARASRGARAPGRPAHDYRGCRDDDCARTACMAWREALAEGREIGFEDGFEAGAAASGREG